jgi:hypothetical protein
MRPTGAEPQRRSLAGTMSVLREVRARTVGCRQKRRQSTVGRRPSSRHANRRQLQVKQVRHNGPAGEGRGNVCADDIVCALEAPTYQSAQTESQSPLLRGRRSRPPLGSPLEFGAGRQCSRSIRCRRHPRGLVGLLRPRPGGGGRQKKAGTAERLVSSWLSEHPRTASQGTGGPSFRRQKRRQGSSCRQLCRRVDDLPGRLRPVQKPRNLLYRACPRAILDTLRGAVIISAIFKLNQ